MDGGEEEERERQLIKRAVKNNYKRKKKLQHRLAKRKDHPQPRDHSPIPPRSLQNVEIATPQGKSKSHGLHTVSIWNS